VKTNRAVPSHQPDEVKAIARSMLLSPWGCAFEIARPWVFLAAFAAVCSRGWWPLAPLLALGCFLASFTLLHDAMHRAIGLPKLANELVIAVAGLLLLKSGHGLRATHLRHHGQVLALDDPEAGVVHWKFARVLWAGPFLILGNRRRAFQIAPRTALEQVVETLLTALLLGFAILLAWHWGSPAGLIYWGVAAAMSATMALWAGYLPHRVPSTHPMIRAAAWAARAWTPVINSLAYHDLHHRCPRVPTARLPALADAVGPEVAFADATIHQP
jgi:fatty acid desaturase